MAFEIRDQPFTEMAVGLLSCEERQVSSKEIERFLTVSELTPITDGGHDARSRETVDSMREGFVQLPNGGDLVADEPAFGSIAVESPTVHDGLPRKPIADKARQAQIGHPRNDAFLARG